MKRRAIAVPMAGLIALVPVLATAAAPKPDPAIAAAAAAEQKRLGSLYVRCDGEPNNMSGAESFARIVGALTLIGLFAPSPEAADPAKRLFGEKGVDACSQVLDNPTQETNGLRRIPLIMARAVHQIEAKNYVAAQADIEKARGEAQALGLIDNVYFGQSMGLGLNALAGEAKLRAGDAAGAQKFGLSDAVRKPFSYNAAVAARPFPEFNRQFSREEERYYQSAQKIVPGFMLLHADRLQEAGRFAEAANLREAIITLQNALVTNEKSSSPLAVAAAAHALAGNWTKAQARADEARDNMAALVAGGTPEADRSDVAELLDFYAVLKLAHEGNLDDARRNFAARSQWNTPHLGAVMAANAMLRKGAKPTQLFGALQKTPDELWEERQVGSMAVRLETDKNNKRLFNYILPYAKIGAYEGMSKQVWRTDKPQFLSKELDKNSRFYSLSVWNAEAFVGPDALLLNAAVQAKARGFPGFVYFASTKTPNNAFVQFGRPDDADIAKPLYLDAAAVIADLRQIIPSPAELAERKKGK